MDNLVEYLKWPTNRGVGSTGGKVLICETRSTRRTTCASATLSSTNPRRNGLAVNTVLSVDRFAMTSVSHGTSRPLALWLVSQGEGRLSTYELWASVVNSVTRSPASPYRTVKLYRPVNWLNRLFLWNLRCLPTCVLRRFVFFYAVVMWTGGWEGHVFWRARPELTCTVYCNFSAQTSVEQSSYNICREKLNFLSATFPSAKSILSALQLKPCFRVMKWRASIKQTHDTWHRQYTCPFHIPHSRHSVCILLIYFPAHSALKTVL